MKRTAHRTIAVPLVCYLAVTVLLPLVGGGYARAACWRHVAVVLVVAVMLAGTAWLLRWTVERGSRAGACACRRTEPERLPSARVEAG